MCNMKRLTENLKKITMKKTKDDRKDVDYYTRKLLDKNMKKLEKYRGV